MPKSQSNSHFPHSNAFVFVAQSPSPSDQRTRGVVRQDKGVLTNARAASRQPAPSAKGSRARLLDTNLYRVNKMDNTKVKLIHTTIHLHPLVRAELARIAEQESLSVSKVGAEALAEWVRWKIHQQQEGLLYPIIRQIIREELRAFSNRIVFFLMRIAFSAEQGRILITNVLKWVLKLFWIIVKLLKTSTAEEGKQDFTAIFNSLVADSNLLAQCNIITKTAQMKRLLEEWEASYRDEREEGKENSND